MDKKDNAEDLEQRVNPYAAPCREKKEIEKLHAPVISLGIAEKIEKYEAARFIYKNSTPLMMLGAFLGATCLYVANIYKNKSSNIFWEFEEKQLSKKSLEEEKELQQQIVSEIEKCS